MGGFNDCVQCMLLLKKGFVRAASLTSASWPRATNRVGLACQVGSAHPSRMAVPRQRVPCIAIGSPTLDLLYCSHCKLQYFMHALRCSSVLGMTAGLWSTERAWAGSQPQHQLMLVLHA